MTDCSASDQALTGRQWEFDVLKRWCDAMLALQVADPQSPALDGGIRCPACGIVHGRTFDVMYPLLHVAHVTGDSRYIDAAIRVQDWSKNVDQPDGGWTCEVRDLHWKGTTVFGAVVLAMALRYHGSLVDAAVRARWENRLVRAMKFLDGFMTMETGNINYPITGAIAYLLAGLLLDNPAWRNRARYFAHESLKFFTHNHFIFGEGKPAKASPKGYWPVDLGYNVEESLPALAQYALLAGDKAVLDRVIASLRTHMEFMLPDGSWDNSWGTRNFKWSWWGSRTSDGCLPAYVLMSAYDARFLEAARRNFGLQVACTHENLLCGGPDYHRCGYPPCLHHTIMHAKGLATVLDCFPGSMQSASRVPLPRDEAYGLRHYDDIGTSLVAVGPWRATVTDYDWEYCPGGHASGGALSMLYHRRLGPVFVGSMTEYRRVEPTNQQAHRDAGTMTLTPRIEYCTDGVTYTNLSDYGAAIQREQTPNAVAIRATGRLCDIRHQSPQGGPVPFELGYRFAGETVRITAQATGSAGRSARLILPVVCPDAETVEWLDAQTVLIGKPGGRLRIHTNASGGFPRPAPQRVFNLVPGFQCLPLSVAASADLVVDVSCS